MNKTADSFRTFIESKVFEAINLASANEATADERVRDMAQLALDLIKPGMTIEQLYLSAVKLDDSFSEFAPVVQSIMKVYEEVHEKKAVDNVSQLIKDGKYDDAHDLVKKVLAFKSQ